MGSDDVSEVIEALPFPYDIKVHRLLCSELINVVNRVSKILEEIEAERPGCSTGIGALCLLNNAIGRAKSLRQHCSESSKLYLALTGDAILARCQKSRNHLEQSLSQLQTMVPIMLAAEISRIISDMRAVLLRLDPSDEDAGKVLRELIQTYKSSSDSTVEIACNEFQVALLRLQITSQKDLLIEKRSIKKMVDKIGRSDPMKRKILLFFQHLLKNYSKLAVKEHQENDLMLHEEPFRLSSSNGPSIGRNSSPIGGPDGAQLNMWSAPEEYKCPLSLRLMYDPVAIASGITFERIWIQRWFDEGHDECPKTKEKLENLSLTPNNNMKNLITEWCEKTGVNLSDPSAPTILESSSSSIGSLSSSVKDLALPLDLSDSSMGSSDSSHAQIRGINLSSMNTGDSCAERSTHKIELEILFELDSLPWKCRRQVVKDIQSFMKIEHETCGLSSCETFIRPLLQFLTDAYNHHDVESQRAGCILFSAFVEKCSSIPCLEEEAYQLLVSFLDTEVAEETLAVLEVLSRHQPCDKEIAASGALHPLLRILDSEDSGLMEPVLKILLNLSAKSEIRSLMAPSDFIPKLIPVFEDSVLARYCLMILKNLCESGDARGFIAGCDGCIASLTQLLESDSQDDQEYAVAILLSLCSQRIQYCHVVMERGVIPALNAITNNGNSKGKAMSMELLRILRDGVRDSEDRPEVAVFPSTHSKGRKSSSKVQGIFSKMSFFSKPSSFASKMKNRFR